MSQTIYTYDKPYGFIYITTNLITGKRYLGQHKFAHTYIDKTYLGSGTALLHALTKYGRDNFNRVIVELCLSQQEMNDCEKFLVDHYNCVQDRSWYNLRSGGAEPLEKIKQDLNGDNNPFYGKKHSEKSKKLIRDSATKQYLTSQNDSFKSNQFKKGIDVWNKGLNTSDETKRKQSERAKNREIVTCPKCDKSGSISTMKRWHFDNCGIKQTLEIKNVICPHCNKEGGSNVMKRWHFNNCRFKP